MQLMLIGDAHAAIELVKIEHQLVDMLLRIAGGEISIERTAAEGRSQREEADAAGDLVALREAMLHRLEGADRLAEDVALLDVGDGEADTRLRRPGDLGRQRYPPPLAQGRDRGIAETLGVIQRRR